VFGLGAGEGRVAHRSQGVVVDHQLSGLEVVYVLVSGPTDNHLPGSPASGLRAIVRVPVAKEILGVPPLIPPIGPHPPSFNVGTTVWRPEPSFSVFTYLRPVSALGLCWLWRHLRGVTLRL
jgi:hypothetical protein